MDGRWKQEAAELLERLENQGHPEGFFHTLRDLIDQRYPRRPGRRKGEDRVPDVARLDRLKELLRSGVSEDEAVKQVAKDDPGDDAKNTRRRLRRKLPRVRKVLEQPSETEKDEVLRRAFEEDVEQWDL